MLRTIPKRIMTHSATLKAVQSTDRWGNATYIEYNLEKVHIQPTHEVTKNSTDKSVNLNSVLFYPCCGLECVAERIGLGERTDEGGLQRQGIHRVEHRPSAR